MQLCVHANVFRSGYEIRAYTAMVADTVDLESYLTVTFSTPGLTQKSATILEPFKIAADSVMVIARLLSLLVASDGDGVISGAPAARAWLLIVEEPILMAPYMLRPHQERP